MDRPADRRLLEDDIKDKRAAGGVGTGHNCRAGTCARTVDLALSSADRWAPNVNDREATRAPRSSQLNGASRNEARTRAGQQASRDAVAPGLRHIPRRRSRGGGARSSSEGRTGGDGAEEKTGRRKGGAAGTGVGGGGGVGEREWS